MTQGTILLVEDSEDDANLTRLAFQRSKILNAMDVAEDGAQALDYLFGARAAGGRSDALPVVVILDLNLPKVSGLDVLRRIRAEERTRFLPVVVLTTSPPRRILACSGCSPTCRRGRELHRRFDARAGPGELTAHRASQ